MNLVSCSDGARNEGGSGIWGVRGKPNEQSHAQGKKAGGKYVLTFAGINKNRGSRSQIAPIRSEGKWSERCELQVVGGSAFIQA